MRFDFERDNYQYVVKQGDSLYKIAKEYGVTVNELLNVNGLKNALIYPNQVLIIPLNNNGEIYFVEYVVKENDTLESIVLKYKTTIDELKALHEKSFAILLTGIPKRQLENAGKLFTYLEANPIVDITKTAQQLGLAYNTTSRLVNAFVKLGLLRQTNTKNKNRVYAYEEYLEILRKGTELGE